MAVKKFSKSSFKVDTRYQSALNGNIAYNSIQAY